MSTQRSDRTELCSSACALTIVGQRTVSALDERLQLLHHERQHVLFGESRPAAVAERRLGFDDAPAACGWSGRSPRLVPLVSSASSM